MGLVKELIKAPIVTRLYNEYMRELEESFVSYDLYSRMISSAIKEQLTVSSDEADKKTIVIEYDEVPELGFDDIEASYIVFVQSRDGLDENAKRIVTEAFESDEKVVLVYADEDEYNNPGTVMMNPWFKPGWSPDTLLDYMYFGGMVAVRSSALDKTVRYSNIYELVLNISIGRKSTQIRHIDAALYHSHFIKRLYASAKYKALREKFARECSVDDIGRNVVSVIIPSKDNPDILEKCIRSLIKLTRDVRYEIVVVDNGSNSENKCKIEELFDGLKQDLVNCEYVEKTVDKPVLKYLYRPQPFNFSRMCNQGAREATGDYLLFLNDDIEIREGRWMIKMLEVASRAHTGAVGAKLYYPGSMMIQHAGIVNLRLGPVHKLQFKDDRVRYYMDSNAGVRNCIAVTGACLMIAKSKFDEVGGFCEELEIAFNDVDLCFRLYESGYHNAVCNNTHLWHHESLTRGQDDTEDKLSRLTAERELLYERHPGLYGQDPYLSKHMSRDILDTGYSFLYEYDYRDVLQEATPQPWKRRIKDVWYNECLMISMEYAAGFEKFEDISASKTTRALISGYAYVAGSDNSCFKRSIILKGEKQSYIIGAKNVYRPDLEENLDPVEYASMTGFCISFKLGLLPPDTYRIAVLAESQSSRLKLYGETNKYIKVNAKQ